jgi:N-acetyl-anhydromuramyl-L-alanine amidase AmpD
MLISPALLARMTDRDLAVVTTLVVHHTADNDENKDIEEIAREEVASQGFVTVGYHAVIHGDGKVQFGRPIGKVPAANLGMNTISYAISLEGNFHPPDAGYRGEKPTDAQIRALIGLVDLVKGKLPNLRYLIGHRDVARIMSDSNDATACPGDLLYARLGEVRRATHLAPR